MLEADFRALSPVCLGPWKAEMPYGGQSPFPVQVALLGQVSWEIATSCFRYHSRGIQWLPHVETL